jgi:hypothetical protein
LIDPWLPEWLPELRFDGLRVGRGIVSLRFWRTGTTMDYEVLEARGAVHMVRQPSPWSLTAGLGERFRDALTSLLPGH